MTSVRDSAADKTEREYLSQQRRIQVRPREIFARVLSWVYLYQISDLWSIQPKERGRCDGEGRRVERMREKRKMEDGKEIFCVRWKNFRIDECGLVHPYLWPDYLSVGGREF